MPDKVPTEGGEALGYNPFAALDASGLKSAAVTPSKAPLSPKPERNTAPRWSRPIRSAPVTCSRYPISSGQLRPSSTGA